MTSKCVLLQTVKTQMNCCMQYFIWVYTVCYDKNDLHRKKYHFYLEIVTCDLSISTMDHPKFIVSNQKKESYNT